MADEEFIQTSEAVRKVLKQSQLNVIMLRIRANSEGPQGLVAKPNLHRFAAEVLRNSIGACALRAPRS